MVLALLQHRGERLLRRGVIGRQAKFLAEGCRRRRQISQLKPDDPGLCHPGANPASAAAPLDTGRSRRSAAPAPAPRHCRDGNAPRQNPAQAQRLFKLADRVVEPPGHLRRGIAQVVVGRCRSGCRRSASSNWPIASFSRPGICVCSASAPTPGFSLSPIIRMSPCPPDLF